jgi:hypothetical protein
MDVLGGRRGGQHSRDRAAGNLKGTGAEQGPGERDDPEGLSSAPEESARRVAQPLRAYQPLPLRVAVPT